METDEKYSTMFNSDSTPPPKKGSKFLAKLVMNYFSNLFYIFVGLLKNDSMMIPDHFKLGRIATGVFRLFMVVGSKLMLTHAHKLRYNETILVVFNPPIGSIWQIIPPGGVNGFTS